MNEASPIPRRKNEHLRICLEEDVSSGLPNGFDAIRLRHKALPEIDYNAVDTSTEFLGHALSTPILISSMTGGSQETARINQILAESAEATQVALALGSQRVGMDSAKAEASFDLRRFAPSIPIFSNLGAMQVTTASGVDACRRVIEIAGADGIYIHLNALQERLQADGDWDWRGVLAGIERVAASIDKPVLVKEVGWGIDLPTLKLLEGAGVAAVDLAGAGGTSWSQVEMYRQETEAGRRLAAVFKHWGMTTTECLQEIFHSGQPGIPVVASGGLRNGLDLAKSLVLGASLGGFARAILESANEGTESLNAELSLIKETLKTAMFACGAASVKELKRDLLYT